MKFKTIAASVAFCCLLTGCDQVRESVADLLQPPTAQEMALRVEKLAGEGKVDKAIQVGEAFLSEQADPSGTLHRQLANLYTDRGDTVSAVRHLQKSLGGTQPAAAARAELAAKPETPAPAPTPVAAQEPGVAAATDGASARVRPDGTLEVRAGSATATVGK